MDSSSSLSVDRRHLHGKRKHPDGFLQSENVDSVAMDKSIARDFVNDARAKLFDESFNVAISEFQEVSKSFSDNLPTKEYDLMSEKHCMDGCPNELLDNGDIVNGEDISNFFKV